MRPRPLSHEFRWLLVGILLRWCVRLAPYPVTKDRDHYFDFVAAIKEANDAISRLPN